MREISALDLRKKFGAIMDEVRYRKEPCMIKKNGRPAIVLIDVDLYKASEERIEEEAFIEKYSEDRLKEFLAEDKILPALAAQVRKVR